MPRFFRASRTLLLALCAALALVGCGRPGPAGDGRLAVVTSISPLGDLIQQVGGDRVQVTTLVPKGADPHDFEPRPADVTAVARARLFLANGLNEEAYLDKLVKNAGSKALRVVVLAQAIGPLQAGGLRYDPQTATNPHLWLSVTAARAYVRAIAGALGDADPAGAEQYRSRAAAYDQELAALDQSIAQQVAAIPPAQRKMVVQHDAWDYFCAQYGIQALPLLSNPEAEPSAQDYARMVDLIRREQVHAVFGEVGFNPKLVEQLARDTGVRFISDLHDDTLGDGATSTYIGMMRDNVRKIAEALQ